MGERRVWLCKEIPLLGLLFKPLIFFPLFFRATTVVVILLVSVVVVGEWLGVFTVYVAIFCIQCI